MKGLGDRFKKAGYLINTRQIKAFNDGFIGTDKGSCLLHRITILFCWHFMGVYFGVQNRIMDSAYSARAIPHDRHWKVVAEEDYLINMKTAAIMGGGVRPYIACWLCFYSLKFGGHFAYYNR